MHPAQHPSEQLKPKQCAWDAIFEQGMTGSYSALSLPHLHHCKAMQSDVKLYRFCSVAFYIHFKITLPRSKWLNKIRHTDNQALVLESSFTIKLRVLHLSCLLQSALHIWLLISTILSLKKAQSPFVGSPQSVPECLEI